MLLLRTLYKVNEIFDCVIRLHFKEILEDAGETSRGLQ